MARDAPFDGYCHAALRHEDLRGKQGLEGTEGVHPVGEEAFDGPVNACEGMNALFNDDQYSETSALWGS